MAVPMSGDSTIQPATSSSANSPIRLMAASYPGDAVSETRSSSRSAAEPARSGSLRWTRHALGGVQLLAQLVHQFELGLQVVDVMLFVGEDAFEQAGGGGILLGAAHDDTRLEPGQHLVLDVEVGLELLAQCLPDPQREQPLIVRQSVEQEDPVGDGLRVGHLLERFFS